jgi:hypothetical protein
MVVLTLSHLLHAILLACKTFHRLNQEEKGAVSIVSRKDTEMLKLKTRTVECCCSHSLLQAIKRKRAAYSLLIVVKMKFK